MTSHTFRMIDANINRISEGLRVLEDMARFVLADAGLTERLKGVRHGVRKEIGSMHGNLLSARDAVNDPGVPISATTVLDGKENISDLTAANFKRVQEGLRVVEESLKITGEKDLSKFYERSRFTVYTVEKTYQDALYRFIRRNVLDTDLYGITSEMHSLGRANVQVVEEMLAAGMGIIQYREKEKSMGDKYRECMAIRELTRQAGARFIVNDHVDLALMVAADGIHIGQDDLPIDKVRELVGESMAIGISTHSPDQARAAKADGADYIGVGPIFRTHTKKDVCDPVGLDYLDYVVAHIDLPFVAIGGIKETNIREVRAHGARCIAMVTEIVGAPNIQEKIACLRQQAENIND